MAAGDADSAARVIERLLADAAFRAEFRHDPAAACRSAGLDDLAEEMAYGAGNAMHTLEIRESRSSLAGVMMAAALEGVGVFEFAQHIVPAAMSAPGVARDVLSRVNLPAVDPLRGALAGAPDVQGGGTAAEASESASASATAPATMALPAQAPAPPATAEPPQTPEPSQAPERPQPAEPAEPPHDPAPAEPAATDPAPAEPTPAVAPAEPAPATPIDPAQFGGEGTGGAADAAALALLENKNVVLDPTGIADIKAGRIDPRVVAVLTKLSEDHEIKVSCMCSDHSKLTSGGSVSNHFHGRGLDIAAVDGIPVNAANAVAREIAGDLPDLDPSARPDEIGTPWELVGDGFFHDADHNDHLHIGFKQEIDPSWQPPAGVAVSNDPSSAPAGGTLSMPAAKGSAASPSRGDSLRMQAVAAETPARPGSGPSHSGSAALADAVGAHAAGAKALAALAEAMKYKGTPYEWGGADPSGFDCSGLVQWAYAQQGIETGRTTYDQIDHPNGMKVAREDLRPGDAVFFQSGGDVHHVGISMGGDKFLHAPHTGDVVKISSLDEPYYAQQFAGGRRFDQSLAEAAPPAPEAVNAASAALARDAVEAKRPGSLIFKALSKQEASNHSSTVRFMQAVRPEQADLRSIAASADVAPAPAAGSLDYPGDGASQPQFAAWLAAHAQQAGLPPELPVMASLVESRLANLNHGDADSVGFFQMRLSVWNSGDYAGYPQRPELQAKWFIDQAVALKEARIAAGDADFGKDPSTWGEWIADVEKPAAQFRDRYQPQLDVARGLLGRTV